MLLTAACTTTSPASPPHMMCDATRVQDALGKSYTVELGAELQQASGSRTMRAISPGQAVTMDYRPDRLNVEMDDTDKITRISCG